MITLVPSTMLGTGNNDMKLCGLYPWRRLRLERRADNKPQQNISTISEIRTKRGRNVLPVHGPVTQAQDLSLFWSATIHESFKAMKSLLHYFFHASLSSSSTTTHVLCVCEVWESQWVRWRSCLQLHMSKAVETAATLQVRIQQVLTGLSSKGSGPSKRGQRRTRRSWHEQDFRQLRRGGRKRQKATSGRKKRTWKRHRTLARPAAVLLHASRFKPGTQEVRRKLWGIHLFPNPELAHEEKIQKALKSNLEVTGNL